MGKIRKHPVEAILLLIIFYAIFFSSSWSGSGFLNKATSLFIAGSVFITLLTLRFAWPDYFTALKQKTVKLLTEYDRTGSSLKYSGYIFLAALLIIALSLTEYFVTLMMYAGNPVVVGFPYPVYSFSVNRFLIVGLFLDLVLYTLLFYLIVRIISENEH